MLTDMAGGNEFAKTHNYSGNKICLDRGYQGKKIIEEVCKGGIHTVGTVKKGHGHCHTFGVKKPQKNQMLIEEKGAMMANWKVRNFTTTKGENRSLFALGLRTGLGRVCLLQTTVATLGPGIYKDIFIAFFCVGICFFVILVLSQYQGNGP